MALQRKTVEAAKKSLISPEITCPICLGVVQTPVITTCTHTFCGHCLDMHFACNSQRSCPVCKMQVNRDRIIQNRALRNIVDNIDIKCPNDECLREMPFAQLELHRELECQYELISCPFCHIHVQRQDLHGHTEECTEKPVACEKCLRPVKKRLMDSHLENRCPEVQVQCRSPCKWKGLRRDYEIHCENKGCEHFKVLCPIFGCGQLVCQHDLQTHIKSPGDSYTLHLKLITAETKANEDRIKNIKKRQLELRELRGLISGFGKSENSFHAKRGRAKKPKVVELE